MTLDSSGRVQIGTDSATNNALLTIKDSGSANPMARIAFDSGDSDVSNGVSVGYTAATFAPDFEIANGDNGIIRFSTNNTERMRINGSDGNIGIGITSPAKPLDVLGSARFVQDAAATTGTIVLRQNSGDTVGSYIQWVNNDNSAQKGYLQIDTSENMKFATGSAERMRIDSSGNVGIGTTSPVEVLHVSKAAATGPSIYITNNSTGHTASDGLQIGFDGSNNVEFRNRENTQNIFYTNNTEAMRLNAGGDLLINTTSQIGSGNARVSVANGSDGVCIATSRSGTSSVSHMQFINGNGTVGSISTSGSSTAFNTSSDYRLKTEVESMTDATARLKQLNPVRFKFLADTSTTLDGFLAHEVQAIIPEAVTGTKDEVDTDGNAVMQGIDQSKIVPLLVATIKELEARIAALES